MYREGAEEIPSHILDTIPRSSKSLELTAARDSRGDRQGGLSEIKAFDYIHNHFAAFLNLVF